MISRPYEDVLKQRQLRFLTDLFKPIFCCFNLRSTTAPSESSRAKSQMQPLNEAFTVHPTSTKSTTFYTTTPTQSTRRHRRCQATTATAGKVPTRSDNNDHRGTEARAGTKNKLHTKRGSQFLQCRLPYTQSQRINGNLGKAEEKEREGKQMVMMLENRQATADRDWTDGAS